MPDKAQPGWAVVSCSRPIMLGEHAADDVFVNIDAKRACNLQCDARTADTRIAAFELDNRADEFLRWSFWAGPSMTSRGEKPPIFAPFERFVESQQSPGLDGDGELGKPARWDEQRCKAQNQAIERIQVRRPPPRSAADE